MKLIVGLGNPGRIYVDSKHNIGFAILKALSQLYKVTLKKDNSVFSLSGRVKIKDQNVILAMPLTFMNLSGIAVAALVKKYKIDLAKLLVVCDDLDLEFGRLKIKDSGSSGGHRGLKSIIHSLGSQGFSRLRIGISRPYKGIDTSSYVLSSFTKKEKEKIKDTIEKASKCCRVWVSEGVTKAMNIFNKSASTSLSTSTRSCLERANTSITLGVRPEQSRRTKRVEGVQIE